MRRDSKILVERLISREITKLINEATYATDTAKAAGTKGLELLNDKNSILYKVFVKVGALNIAKETCTNLANGKYDLSVLDKLSNAGITVITEAFAAVISPMNTKEINAFKETDPKEMQTIINQEGAGYPKVIRDCVFKIHGLLHDPNSSYVNKGINAAKGYINKGANYIKNATQKAKNSNINPANWNASPHWHR